MAMPKCFGFFVLVLMIIAITQNPREVEARPITLSSQEGYSMMFATLGIVCKCCDGEGDECRSTWKGFCSKPQCLPWKFH
ncbi:hypothetical protein CFOL_v3_00377 [Cephalotus follicularis]|uniref:Uncharacterized protein n=1 Tax=Cephalotus follicularis TaxID=3775 RepID=A0A1Q3AMH6_CEPFO|nr:hypothetical protein CFOL_v3_00377 [Cephalotus follicularis]